MQGPVLPAPSKAPASSCCTSSPSHTHSSQQMLLGVMALEFCSSFPLCLVLSTPHSSCSSFYNHLEHYSHQPLTQVPILRAPKTFSESWSLWYNYQGISLFQLYPEGLLKTGPEFNPSLNLWCLAECLIGLHTQKASAGCIHKGWRIVSEQGGLLPSSCRLPYRTWL